MIDSFYSVDHLGSPSCQKTISMVQEQLANDGCSVIRNFFSDDGLNILLREAEECLDYDYCSTKKLCNVYLGNGNPEFTDDHPQNIFLERANGFKTADLFESESYSYRIYYWEPLKQFLADCLKKGNYFIRIQYQI